MGELTKKQKTTSVALNVRMQLIDTEMSHIFSPVWTGSRHHNTSFKTHLQFLINNDR